MVDGMDGQGGDLLPVSAAARRLGVGEQQVRQWIRGEQLDAIRIGRSFFVPIDAVDRFERSQRASGRPFTSSNAWGLLFMASGEHAPWLSPSDRWRVKRYLAENSVSSLRGRLGGRAKVKRLRAHPSLLASMRDDPDLMLSGVSAAPELRLNLIGGEDQLDAYAPGARADDVVHRYALRPSRDPNVILRVVPDIGLEQFPRVAPTPAVALDLLEHPEPRVRQVGQELLGVTGS